jgi:NADPH:quinone reductase-like Zn-dependent oxidoreductase
MKQVINLPGLEVKVKITSAPIPSPSAKQVLIKVIVSGCNPKDWKMPEFAASYNGPDDDSFLARSKAGINQGDDIAGIVESVGEDVIEFKVRGLQRRDRTEGG